MAAVYKMEGRESMVALILVEVEVTLNERAETKPSNIFLLDGFKWQFCCLFVALLFINSSGINKPLLIVILD